MERVIFEVPGKPQGKGRPRASVVGGHARMYTPAGTASYENKIMLCYQQRHAGVRFAPPIVLEVDAYFAIPKSYPKKRLHCATKISSVPHVNRTWTISRKLWPTH